MGLTLEQAIAYTKHSEMIKAFAEGQKIQYFSKRREKWITVTAPKFTTNFEYRIAPVKKTEITLAFNGYSKKFLVEDEDLGAIKEYVEELNLVLGDFANVVGENSIPSFTLTVG